MRVFQAVITVNAQGEILLPPMPNLPPGSYNAVLVIEDAPAQEAESANKMWLELRPVSPNDPPKDSTSNQQEN
jgi:hypothetical protein